MRKILAFLLLILSIFAFTACSSKEISSQLQNNQNQDIITEADKDNISSGSEKDSDDISSIVTIDKIEQKISRASLAAEIALKYQGYPYCWGGSSPETGFDCSGLVYYCFNSAGITLNERSSKGQYLLAKKISEDELRPGDLIFFVNTYDTDGISHVEIYLGNGQMIGAETETVAIGSLNSPYWQEHLYSYGRIE